MGRKKQQPWLERVRAWLPANPLARIPWRKTLWVGLQIVVFGGGLAGGAYGLLRAEKWVLASPDYTEPARIRLPDAPADLRERVEAALTPLSDRPWSDPNLCADIARTLEECAWVRRVVAVERSPGGVIEARCEYRMPLALIAADRGFYLIDEEGIRLPGQYAYHSAFKLIQGVRATAPQPGQLWKAPEISAAVKLIQTLSAEPFTHQVKAVVVDNHAGRADARGAQLELSTDRPGGRVIWGSALGQEIEENTAAQKLDILRANYRSFGHIDANETVIDVSVYPDRVKIPA